ncbi:hypothetical protein HC931_07605 [Candidatus Gracilibacteria bacterium]|nr:hypothetical protein [Candidatus Gracilibacteria bacterium]NJP19766.1 hypothetical protein [Hydrococcus sp. CRU_1_1]
MNDFASNSLLFNTSQAAYAIAYTLEGEWDGCNGVVLSSEIDENVIEVAIALVAQDLKEKIKSCPLGEYCTLLFPTLTMGKVLSESQQWFFDIRENCRNQGSSTDVPFENNPQVIRLLTELEPESLLLNTYEYRLSPEIEAAFWRIAWQGRKYGIRTIKVETRQQGLALSHAICDRLCRCPQGNRCKIVDLFDYQTPN